MASRWLDECLDGHIVCRKSITGRFIADFRYTADVPLPQRVIDTFSLKLVNSDSLKKGQSNSKGHQAGYVALSYRWGENPLKLSRSREEEFECGLPLSEVPIRIRDAIDVARELDIRYLWVDALCINQVDKDKRTDDERKKEVSRMASIYENALVTIVMLQDPDCTTSFFDGSYEAGFRDLWASRYDEDEEAEIANTEWNQRGWVFQEYLASRRILLIGERKLTWRCSKEPSKSTVEEGPMVSKVDFTNSLASSTNWVLGEVSSDTTSISQSLHLKASRDRDRRVSGAPQEYELRGTNSACVFVKAALTDMATRLKSRTMWAPFMLPIRLLTVFQRPIARVLRLDLRSFDSLDPQTLLRDYSRRRLTYSADRLKAFQGLGTLIAQRTRQDFIFGVWDKLFAMSLFWHNLDEESECRETGVAPSWSWASRLGPIDFYMASDSASIAVHVADVLLSLCFTARGAYLGDLKGKRLKPANAPPRMLRYFPSIDAGGPRGAHGDNQRISLVLEALCLDIFITNETADKFPTTCRSLQGNLNIWPEQYRPWNPQFCRLVFAPRSVCKTSRYRGHVAKHLFKSEECNTHYKSELAQIRYEDNLATPSADEWSASGGLGNKLVGIVRFDQWIDVGAERNFKIVLLWHTSKALTLEGSQDQEYERNEHGSSERSGHWRPYYYACKRVLWQIAKQKLPHQRTYFFLVIRPANQFKTGGLKYERVGIGIGHWLPHKSALGGIDMKAAATVEKIEIV